MTPKDIALKTTWPEVERALRYFYPEYGTKTMRKAYKAVREAPKRRRPKEKIVILARGENEWNDTPYYHTATDRYSLSFRPWAETAVLPFDEETLKHVLPVDALAHFLWEITWYGDEGKTVKVKRTLVRRVKEIKASLNKK